MKFSAPVSELQKCLGSISTVIPSKSTLPILENFLFDLSGDQLNIIATDLEIFASVSLKVKGNEDGKIAVPAKRLLETVRALTEEKVNFKADNSSYKIEMATNNGVYKLTGESSESYPTVPSAQENEELEVESESLRRLINKTAFAVSTDELRPAMTGVLLQLNKSGIRAVATDGHRLVKLTNKTFLTGKTEKELIIPAKALNLVAKCIEGTISKITLNESQTTFHLGNITMVSRVIEEKYPNYESVLPLENDKKLIVNKNQLLSAVRRTALYASSTTHLVRFSMTKKLISVSAEDIDFGSEAKETMECEYGSESLEIGFNSTYVMDVLNHVDSEEVEFLFSTPARAAIVKPAKQQPGEDLLMLVMPVRLNV